MKRIVTIILAIILCILLVACNTNNLAKYKKAFEKTEQITKGQSSGELQTTIDFNTDGLSAEEIKELSYMKDSKISFNVVFDDEQEKAIFRNYMNLGGLGFDFQLFVNENELFMKVPIAGKYMRLDDVKDASNINEETLTEEFISNDSLNSIKNKWLSLMNEEDVFKGKDIVLTTPDGEVKTTEFTISLSNEQIQTMASESIEILYRDNNLKRVYEENKIEENNLTYEEMLDKFKNNKDKYTVDNFKYTALVDIDDYIVSESIIFTIKSINEDNPFKSMDYSFNIKNWDINKNQIFEYPILTEENTLSNEDSDLQNVMENLFLEVN